MPLGWDNSWWFLHRLSEVSSGIVPQLPKAAASCLVTLFSPSFSSPSLFYTLLLVCLGVICLINYLFSHSLRSELDKEINLRLGLSKLLWYLYLNINKELSFTFVFPIFKDMVIFLSNMKIIHSHEPPLYSTIWMNHDRFKYIFKSRQN